MFYPEPTSWSVGHQPPARYHDVASFKMIQTYCSVKRAFSLHEHIKICDHLFISQESEQKISIIELSIDKLYNSL